MDIMVYVNGDGYGHRTHVSVFLRPLVGVYDSSLSRPFVGAVHVAILNQVDNENHYSQTFEFEADDNVQAGVSLQPAIHLSLSPDKPTNHEHRVPEGRHGLLQSDSDSTADMCSCLLELCF